MSFQEHSTQPDTSTQESFVTGLPTADATPARFPDNILGSEVMEIRDLQELIAVSPKGEPVSRFTAKLNWLPCNEQLAVQLGHAQAALRLLDDQRAICTSVEIYPDLILIDLARAPDERKAMWQHIDAEGGRLVVTADLKGANESVLLRWPLEKAA